MHVAGGQAIVPNVIQAVDVARQRGIPVIWVRLAHTSPLFVFCPFFLPHDLIPL